MSSLVLLKAFTVRSAGVRPPDLGHATRSSRLVSSSAAPMQGTYYVLRLACKESISRKSPPLGSIHVCKLTSSRLVYTGRAASLRGQACPGSCLRAQVRLPLIGGARGRKGGPACACCGGRLVPPTPAAQQGPAAVISPKCTKVSQPRHHSDSHGWPRDQVLIPRPSIHPDRGTGLGHRVTGRGRDGMGWIMDGNGMGWEPGLLSVKENKTKRTRSEQGRREEERQVKEKNRKKREENRIETKRKKKGYFGTCTYVTQP